MHDHNECSFQFLMSTKSSIKNETNFYQGKDCLDLSNKKLVCVPREVLVLSSLKVRYFLGFCLVLVISFLL